MRLLFDENLSQNLCRRLSDLCPDAEQVRAVGLEHASDMTVWEYAKRQHRIIVTKDSDFHQLSFLYGAPPKVVWLRAGNCSTDMIETLIQNIATIEALDADLDAAILVIDV